MPEDGSTESVVQPEIHLPMAEDAVNNIVFHPAAEHVLSSTAQNHVRVWDIGTEQVDYGMDNLIASRAYSRDRVYKVKTRKNLVSAKFLF